MAKIVIILATCAAVIFAGIKVIPPILHHLTDTPTAGVTSVNAKTVPMPPTQTNCPAPGTARAAVTALLILGKHQNLVYTENADTGSGGGAPGILKRYDVITHQTTQIVQLATTSISNAQISTDGQWILFTSQVNGRAAIQMIRMDRQGLQTLYCAPANLATSNSSSSSLYSLAWSTDQKTVMFIQQDVSNGQSPPLYLLNLAKGAVQKELSLDSNSSITYFPRVWIDNTHIALLAEAPSGNSQGESIYVLDTKNGTNQQSNALKLIITVSTACFGFDISPDHKEFFLVRCNINSSISYINYQGPSSITTLPVTGGSESTIYTTQTLAVTGLRVISSTTLLVSITAFANDANFSQNGLYTMRIDGTGLTKIVGNDFIGDTPTQNINLNQSSPYTWSVTSRNSRLYSLLLIGCGMHCTFTLLFGSLTGGTLTTLASGSSSGAFSLTFVGWTTM